MEDLINTGNFKSCIEGAGSAGEHNGLGPVYHASQSGQLSDQILILIGPSTQGIFPTQSTAPT
jgi:hypothetical protein